MPDGRAPVDFAILEQIFETAAFAIALVDAEGRPVRVNRTFERMVGYTEAELSRMTFAELTHPEDVALDVALYLEMARGERSHYQIEKRYIRKDGAVIWGRLTASAVAAGHGILGVGMVEDITERRDLQQQLAHASKLEAVGRLAGGLAHDFNNLLTVILCVAQLMKEQDRGREDTESLGEIEAAARRASDLTGQLLTFARRQIVQLRVVNLNDLVDNLDKMLRRVLGEHVDLVTIRQPGLGAVRADPGQLEQVIVNLAVNARDAMREGGQLTIETKNVVLGEDYAASHSEVTAGDYVLVSVSDTGVGMDEPTRSRLFEPFFTTKGLGQGTGLGLATSYGIVKQCGGSISVHSELGTGSTFTVYLPRVQEGAVALPSLAPQGTYSGHETLLLVEDDEPVRRVAVRSLRGCGYEVIEVSNGKEALLAFESRGARIHLVISDVVMPRMNGTVLVEELRRLKPDLKVLFTSGYAENNLVHQGVVDPKVNFLAKPYVPKDLARSVRETLDAR